MLPDNELYGNRKMFQFENDSLAKNCKSKPKSLEKYYTQSLFQQLRCITSTLCVCASWLKNRLFINTSKLISRENDVSFRYSCGSNNDLLGSSISSSVIRIYYFLSLFPSLRPSTFILRFKLTLQTEIERTNKKKRKCEKCDLPHNNSKAQLKNRIRHQLYPRPMSAE